MSRVAGDAGDAHDGQRDGAGLRGAQRTVSCTWGEWVERSLVTLSGGDVTKLRVICAEWGPAESDPYLRRCLEREAVDRAILGFCGVQLPWMTDAPQAKRAQGIGEFCGKSCLAECTQYFGDGLAQACRTCPN